MGFRIRIMLANSPGLLGIDSLDFCRKHGLPDSLRTFVSNGIAACDVDEAFARIWFRHDQLESTVIIPVCKMMPGELKFGSGNYSDVASFSTTDQTPPGALTDDRMRELYIAGRFLALTQELERLKEPAA